MLVRCIDALQSGPEKLFIPIGTYTCICPVTISPLLPFVSLDKNPTFLIQHKKKLKHIYSHTFVVNTKNNCFLCL